MRNWFWLNPASASAAVKYGWSKLTQRVDEVVSGRMTPISSVLAPLVAYWVSGLSAPMVDAMSGVKALTVMLDGTPGVVAVDPPDGVEVLPHAAATSAPAPTRVSLPILDRSRGPRPLIPSCKCIRPLPSIPNPPFATPPAPGAKSAAHKTSLRQRPDGSLTDEGLSTPRTKNHPNG